MKHTLSQTSQQEMLKPDAHLDGNDPLTR
jgi:hypothetical protein